jgi:predicted nucleotidyltransferase
MSVKLLNISNKIDSSALEILKLIDESAKSLQIDFFVIGATARDIIFNMVHNIKSFRATNDIDFSIRIKTWDEFEKLTNSLIKKGFAKSNIVHRFQYKSIPSIDIVPFGKISTPETSIIWPDKQSKEMNVLGFEECFADSEDMKVSSNPDLIIKIASVRGLVIMKLIAWKDGFPSRSRDALDILYIIKNYIEAGNSERLFKENNDLVDDNFDFELTGAILLGRDIAKLASPTALSFINEILDYEIKNFDTSPFITDMLTGEFISDKTEKKRKYLLQLITNLRLGMSP